MYQERRKLVGIILAAFIVLICSTPQFRTIVTIPRYLEITHGNIHNLQLQSGLALHIYADRAGVVKVNGKTLTEKGLTTTSSLVLEPIHLGKITLHFRLLGILPIRSLTINVVPKMELIPGGQSIGVNLYTKGVLVVGLAKIMSGHRPVYPAREAGIKVGDQILAVNGFPLTSVAQLEDFINKCGQQGKVCNFLVERNDKQITISAKPAKCDYSGSFRMGMYVKDRAAGVGTLTFVDPNTGVFGALGHVVADAETNQPLQIREGNIVKACVTSIEQGRPGSPGQKHSISVDGGKVLGEVEKNTNFGIFGEILDDELLQSPVLPIALMDQIQPGPAEIWTVVEGQRVERFKAQINKVTKQYSPMGKGLIIEITDKRLLSKTGGIVQGMSGSPIVQNGRLVGAVTHVFLNNPARGYGCFIEFMILESGLLHKEPRNMPTILWPLRRAG